MTTIGPGATPTAGVAASSSAAVSGATTTRLNSAATTNATNVKASAGRLYKWLLTNTSAAAKFVKFYNKASAPTVGTDLPVLTVTVPANATVAFSDPIGWSFATGIGFAITGAVTDADATAVAAGDVLLTIEWM